MNLGRSKISAKKNSYYGIIVKKLYLNLRYLNFAKENYKIVKNLNYNEKY